MSLISRARAGDKQAIETMFRQFIPPDEQIDDVAFLGLKGLLGIGVHSFGAVTPRRAAGLEVGVLGGVVYRDGYYEHVNSTAVFHPSRILQIVLGIAAGLFWFLLFVAALSTGSFLTVLLVLVLGIIGVPLTVKLYFRFVKSGLVFIVREGLNVYVFADRSRLPVANRMSQRASQLREVRLRSIRGDGGRTARSLEGLLPHVAAASPPAPLESRPRDVPVSTETVRSPATASTQPPGTAPLVSLHDRHAPDVGAWWDESDRLV